MVSSGASPSPSRCPGSTRPCPRRGPSGFPPIRRRRPRGASRPVVVLVILVVGIRGVLAQYDDELDGRVGVTVLDPGQNDLVREEPRPVVDEVLVTCQIPVRLLEPRSED